MKTLRKSNLGGISLNSHTIFPIIFEVARLKMKRSEKIFSTETEITADIQWQLSNQMVQQQKFAVLSYTVL